MVHDPDPDSRQLAILGPPLRGYLAAQRQEIEMTQGCWALVQAEKVEKLGTCLEALISHGDRWTKAMDDLAEALRSVGVPIPAG